MKKLFYLLFLIIISSDLLSQDVILFAKMKYIDYNYDSEDVLLKCFFEDSTDEYDECPLLKKIKITNGSCLRQIENCFKDTKTDIRVDICENILIGLKIYHLFGKVDTVAFGRCYVMYYNGKFYKPDLNLLKLIIPYMEKKYQKDYYNYVKELEKFLENE